MGHSLDAAGKPLFSSTPTQTVTDLQAAVDYAETVGGLLKLTSTERNALTSDETQPGWLIAEKNTGYLYLVLDGEPQGRLIYSDTGDQPISLNGGWSTEPGSPSPTYRVKGSMASLNGRIRAGTGATTHAFTLPPEARPSGEIVMGVMTDDSTFETVIINPSGAVTFYDLIIPATDYRLASIPAWPTA